MPVEFITIHHPKIKAEAVSTRIALAATGGLGDKGWKAGKLPKPKSETKAKE